VTRSCPLRLLALSSHRFLLNVNTTTGRSSLFFRYWIRCTQAFLSVAVAPPNARGPYVTVPVLLLCVDMDAPPRLDAVPRWLAFPLPLAAAAPRRCKGGRPAASRSLSCLRLMASLAEAKLSTKQCLASILRRFDFATHPSERKRPCESTIVCNSFPAHK